MKKGQWILGSLVFVLVVLYLGTGPILAEKEALDLDLSPQITYNPIEKWRLGAGLKLKNLLGNDQVIFSVQNALFTTKDYSSMFSYVYTVDQNDFYLSALDELRYQGIFNKTGFYQRDQYVSVGMTRKVFKPNYYYAADLMIKGAQMLPANQPADFEFDQGIDLGIYPSVFGSYKGILGKLDLVIGVPTSFSDYKYVKVNALVKRSFDLSRKDRFVVSSQAGYIGGDYPNQRQFYLGSSERDLFPNAKAKFIGKVSSFTEESMTAPEITLDGFQDNVFYGDKMYLTKFEYQRTLLSSHEAPDLPRGMRIVGKVYTVFGDAWSGAVIKGFEDPKTAVGTGLQIDFPMIYPDMYISLNLARGINEGAATTFGVELGSTMQFAFMLSSGE